MARPFDEQLSSQYTSSMSSQTSLAANRAWATAGESAYPASTIYGDDGRIRKYKNSPKASKESSRPRLAKIKSSPSNGALAAARKSAGRLHKRGMSASATQSPVTPTFDANQRFPDLTTPPSVHSDPNSVFSSKAGVKGKVKIRPLLRKLSSSDANSIDLSRSAAENEGLGIYNPSDYVSEGRPNGEGLSGIRGYHHRSNSQVSTITTSSTTFHGSQYVHPFRQTPRPYTPPLVNSYKNSLDEEPTIIPGAVPSSNDAPDPDSYYGQPVNTTSYAPLPSSRRVPPPLHIRTHSSSRLTSSSQTNLPGTPSSLRQQNDTKAADIMLPSARSSLDTIFHKRSRANTATNPETGAAKHAAQVATIHSLRQQFKDEQEAKDLKYQEAEARKQAKELAKRQKREASETRKSEHKERKRTKSNAASEKTVPMGDYDTTHPYMPPSHGVVQPRRRRGTGASAGKGIRNRWQLFWFKFKTAWLKFKRAMSGK